MSLTKYHDERFTTDDIYTALAGEAIATARMCCVLSSGELVKTTADTDEACGLALENYADGDQAQYVIRGKLRFIAGGTIAVGDPLCPDDGTAGEIRTAISGDRVIGKALTTGADGEYATGMFDFIATHLLA
jgi:hypothetical protein